MRSIPALMACAAILLTAAPDAGAAKPEPLQPGGYTIGGPGRHKLAAGQKDIVWESPVSLNICATVQNTGKSDVKIRLVFPNPIQEYTVRPAQTGARCDSRRRVEVECLGPGTCNFGWRVDRR